MGLPWEDFAGNAAPASSPKSGSTKTYSPLDAIHLIESSGASDARADIVNPASGARGSMQVRPATAIAPGFGVKPSKGTPEDDARAGRDYYSALEKRYGDSSKAAIAYDMGPGAYDKWQAAGGDTSKLPAETRKYLTRFRELTGSADLYSDKAAGGAPWEQFGSSKLDAGAKPQASAPSAKQPPQTLAGFVGGNLAKGVAQTAGPIAEGAQKLADLPARAGNAVMDLLSGRAFKPTGATASQQAKDELGRRADGMLPGRIAPPPSAGPLPTTANRLPVGEQPLTEALTKTGAIGSSAEPRTTAQRYAAAGLQALPSALLPGGGMKALGRVGAAVVSGIGGEAGRQVGGTPGQIAGSLLGGGLGGMAGAERGIPKPPSEAARASQASGIPLTLGQETGSTALKFTENRLRELFPSAGTAHADELAQVTAGANRVNDLADQMSKGSTADPEAIGLRLRSAYNGTVKKIDAMRDMQAKTDYDAVRQLAGDKPVIGYKNTMSALDRIIAEHENVPAADSRKIVSQARSIKDALTETRAGAPGAPASPILGASGQPLRPAIPAAPTTTGTATHTINDAMKTRSAWGKAARRSGNIFSDIDPNANQVLAKRLFGAINRDFDDASTAATPIAKALKTANTNYKQASDSITFVEKSALGKLLGEDVADAAFSGQAASTKAPELIAKRYLNMQPSEARSVTAILQQHAPDVLNDARSFVLRNGLEAAKNDVPGAPPISFAKFRKEMDRVQPKLEELGFSKKEITDIKDVTDTMARAGDKTGSNPSKTTGAAHMLSIPALAVTHPVAAVAAVVTPFVASKALLTQGGRDLLRKAYSASAPAARAAAIGALRSQYAQPARDSGSDTPSRSGAIPAPPQNAVTNPF